MSNNATDRVSVVKVFQLGSSKAKEWAVLLDTLVILRTGSATRYDYCEAASFAKGLVKGLEIGAAK